MSAVLPEDFHQKAPVVFLIHGIDDDGSIFCRMGQYLGKSGYRPFVIEYSPSDGRVGIDQLAEQVRPSVEKVLKNNPGRYAVVGFSMGGLVARALFASDSPLSDRPEIFISISSPHAGTWMAWSRLNEAGRQMCPGSSFIDHLNARRSSLDGIRLATIRTPFDLVILPSSSSILPGARNDSVPVLLHPFMVKDKRVICRVIEMLDDVFYPLKTLPAPRSADLCLL